MRTKEISIYKFDELSKEAQARALTDQREWNTEGEWYDFVYEDLNVIGGLLGLTIEEKRFSGFCSQGDGASFSGSYAPKKNMLAAIKNHAPQDETLHGIALALDALQDRFAHTLTGVLSFDTGGMYVHENTVSYDFEIDVLVAADVDWLTIDQEVGDVFRALMRWFYGQLEAQYNYLTTDEAVTESLKANESEFLGDGALY